MFLSDSRQLDIAWQTLYAFCRVVGTPPTYGVPTIGRFDPNMLESIRSVVNAVVDPKLASRIYVRLPRFQSPALNVYTTTGIVSSRPFRPQADFRICVALLAVTSFDMSRSFTDQMLRHIMIRPSVLDRAQPPG